MTELFLLGSYFLLYLLHVIYIYFNLTARRVRRILAIFFPYNKYFFAEYLLV